MLGMQSPVFVFFKEGEFRCLGSEDSKNAFYKLISEGWKHKATLAAHIWIESALNGGVDILQKEITCLRT